MVNESIPESELQLWFERAAKESEIAGAIQNMPQLQDKLTGLNANFKVTDRIAREGLQNALDICSHLHEIEPLSANESIALEGFSQMRPDLVLHTSSAHYVLVELKTRPGPERQGVQELLAYSAAIKMQMPYVNETLYIIVAQAWDTLLSFSVRALIMDGKRVLPLQWCRSAPRRFEFTIRLDLFEYDFVHSYDPFYALSASIFACSRPNFDGPFVSAYFGWHATCAVADCKRMEQCRFLLSWSSERDGEVGLMSTALLTLNQHWTESEYLPSHYRMEQPEMKPGIVRVINRQAQKANMAVWADAGETNDEDGPDIARINTAAYAYSRKFPQNSVSYEILERRRIAPWEQNLKSKDARVNGFEIVDFMNLKRLLEMLTSLHSMRVEFFEPFGELEDFVRRYERSPWDVDEIVTMLSSFREHKGYSDAGRTDQQL